MKPQRTVRRRRASHQWPGDAGHRPGTDRRRLLVVEDDDGVAEPLIEGLELEGYTVERARSGTDALAAAPGDLVLLDLGLPDLDGHEVCRRLRASTPVPIIVVTARDDEIDRVLLLELGADDYVVKPFGFRELLARIHAVLRRVDGSAPRQADRRGARRRAHQRHLFLAAIFGMWWLVEETNEEGTHDAELLPFFALIPPPDRRVPHLPVAGPPRVRGASPPPDSTDSGRSALCRR